MGSGGTSSQSATTTTQNTGPWSPQQSYLTDIFGQARNQYYGANPQTVNGMQVPDPNAGPQYFPGSTVAPFAPETQQALQLQAQRAQAGSPVLSAAQQYAQNVLSGNYLNAGNPYFNQVVQSVTSAVKPQVDSSFIGAGRYGSPAYNDTMAQAIANAIAPYAFNNYSNERNIMQQTQAQAPALANADYTDIGALADVGAQRQALAQAQLQDQVNRWNFNQNAPAARLAQYLGMIQGNYGVSGVNTSNQSGNTTTTPTGPQWISSIGSLIGGLRGV